jgi:hypothetical protein
MDPCDFWLFPILKTPLKGFRLLHAIPKEAFQNFFQRWRGCCAKCVESQVVYFED